MTLIKGKCTADLKACSLLVTDQDIESFIIFSLIEKIELIHARFLQIIIVPGFIRFCFFVFGIQCSSVCNKIA